MIETLAAMAVWSAASYLVVLGVMLLTRRLSSDEELIEDGTRGWV